MDSRVNTEKSTVMEVDRRLPSLNPDEGADLENVDSVNDAVGKGNRRVNLGLTTVVGKIPAAPQNTPVSCTDPGIQHTRDDDPIRTFLYPEEELSGQPKVNLQRPKGLVRVLELQGTLLVLMFLGIIRTKAVTILAKVSLIIVQCSSGLYIYTLQINHTICTLYLYN